MQKTLDGFDSEFINGYKCKSCLKFFQTMKEVSKHTARHVKHRRKTKTINYCLEQFATQSIQNDENSNMLNVARLRWVN